MRAPSEPHGLWPRIVGWGFRRLYNELAWTYDLVSWLASLGEWRRWQRAVFPYLPAGGRVLEVGCGPGHLLADLAAAGFVAAGLDASPAMLRLARRRLRQQGCPATLLEGRAEALPFSGEAFDAIVATFPTNYLYDRAWLAGAHRVLQPGGQLVVVEMATFRRRGLTERTLEWAYAVTGQRGPAPDTVALLAAAGFRARRESAFSGRATVQVVVGEKVRSWGSGLNASGLYSSRRGCWLCSSRTTRNRDA